MTNKSGPLYTGVTNNLERRVFEHKAKLIPGFTSQYNVSSLAYFEVCQDIRSAIGREKQIKGWIKAKTIVLIESRNPKWQGLSSGWYNRDSSLRSE